jgi:two-component system, chemotaxis family, CheB/CheR fusion protein
MNDAPDAKHAPAEGPMVAPPAEPALDGSLVVGIGASAGGLEAFRTFFSVMPADSGITFVLIQHLDPAYPSALVELIRSCTAMDVQSAEDGMPLGPDRVFVIPPDAVLRLDAGVLRLTSPAPPAERRVSINTFLMSLAEDQGPNAVGIILSGFGSDGALGIEAIKEHGGLTLTQAEFDHAPKLGMPQSASAGGFVDHVLPIEEMPTALLDYSRYRTKMDSAQRNDSVSADVTDHLGAISAVLNSRLGRDFSQYKSNTIMRRVQRRMMVLRVDSVSQYIKQLRERADEPSLLFREMLIRVTRFFRDRDVFETLARECLPPMLAKGGDQAPVRVWVPGCATGEEAYSLAILFKEAIAHADRPRRIQIFATDIDDRAIEVARAGIYPDTILADLSSDRIERYFVKEGDTYRVSRDVREMCLFSVHDLVKDPPFSKLDLISCRNLLIYFGSALQKRVIETFHYGLKPNGILLVGTTEALTAHGGFFGPIQKKHRLFKRLEGPVKRLISPPGGFSPVTHAKERLHLTDKAMEGSIARALGQFTPAYVIIDQQQIVQRFSGPIAKYLEPATGPASLHLSSLVHASLRAPLRAAIKEADSSQLRTIAPAVVFHIDDRTLAVNLVVEPLKSSDKAVGALLVAFQDVTPRQMPAATEVVVPNAPENMAQEELIATQRRFHTVTQELEAANEELQSANEEYQSVNEELQSANEELETSKEELQSINEELQTVNAELNARNENLVELNSDLANFIDSTSIATLFLDSELRIKRFTPPILELFNLREGDEGRPITDIVSQLASDGLESDARQVLRTLIPVRREVALAGGESLYQMQVRPYRDLKNVINGVVMTFVDISERKRAEQIHANLAAIIDSSEDAIIGHNLQGMVESWNPAAEAIYGYTAKEAIGRPITALLGGEQMQEWPELQRRLLAGESIRHFDSVQLGKDGRAIDVSLTISPIKDADGRMIGASAIARDITQRKSAEHQATLLLGELDHRVKNILAVVTSIVRQTLKTIDTPQGFASSIEGRIQAIAKAHNLITQKNKAGMSLTAIVNTELAAYLVSADRVTVSGSDITLTPKAGIALSLAIHELTTNAVKYGGFATCDGRLSISWYTFGKADHNSLRMEWEESSTENIEPPTKRGFGTTLLERSLALELDADVTREFRPSGLFCRIDIPLTEEVTPSGHA